MRIKKSLDREKFFDLSKTVISIGLAGLLTTIIAHCYQTKDEDRRVFAQARDAATQTCYKIIDAMGERHYAAFRAAVGFRWAVEQDERWQKYNTAVEKWNKNRYSMLALANRYFGQETEDKIYSLIKTFNQIHSDLTRAKNAYVANEPIPDLKNTLQTIYQLDDDISNFSKDLQERLKEGKVDIYSPKPPISKPMGTEIKH